MICSIDFDWVMSAASEFLKLLVGIILHHLQQARILPEKVSANIFSAGDRIFLKLPIGHLLHSLDKQLFFVFL